MIVCTELYLLAKGVGSGLLDAEEVVVLVLLTVQTSGLLLHVALAAAAVQEQVRFYIYTDLLYVWWYLDKVCWCHR